MPINDPNPTNLLGVAWQNNLVIWEVKEKECMSSQVRSLLLSIQVASFKENWIKNITSAPYLHLHGLLCFYCRWYQSSKASKCPISAPCVLAIILQAIQFVCILRFVELSNHLSGSASGVIESIRRVRKPSTVKALPPLILFSLGREVDLWDRRVKKLFSKYSVETVLAPHSIIGGVMMDVPISRISMRDPFA